MRVLVYHPPQADKSRDNRETSTSDWELIAWNMFSKDICQLVGRRNILNQKLFAKDLITDKVKINLYVLGAGMEDRVSCKSSNTDIVTPDQRSVRLRNAQLFEHKLNPGDLNDEKSKCPVLRFCTSTRDDMLLSGGPWDEIGAKKKTKAIGASSIIGTWSPIRIGIALKRPRWWGMDRKTMSSSTFEIAKYAFSSLQMRSGRMSHVLTSSIYCKWDFWSCESDVLKSTHKTAIVSSIKNR